jgi:hypothetical protein
MTDTNHIGDLNEIVGDAVAKCESCGVPWAEHMGIMGVCATNAQLRKERDEARREVLEAMHPDLRLGYANAREWDCFKRKHND